MLLPAIVLLFFHWDLPSLGAYHDDSVYLVTAKAIAEGKGYRIESLPDERWETKYPPVFPLALAVVWRLAPHFPENAAGFLVVAWLALPAWLALQARMMAKLDFRPAIQLAACLWLLGYEGPLLLSVTLLADLWFCCAALVAILLAERASAPDGNWKFAAAAGIAAAAACLTKSSGVVLLASIGGVLVLKRQWRNALAFCALLFPVLAAWYGWSFAHRHPVADYNDIFYSSYWLEFTQKKSLPGLLPRLLSHGREFLVRLGSLLVPGFLQGVGFDWLRCLGGLLGGMGVVRLCRSGRAWHYAAFAALYWLETCVWPSPLYSRYVLAVVPLWIAGLLALPQYCRPASDRVGVSEKPPMWAPAALGVLAVAYVFQFVVGLAGATHWRSQRQALQPAYAWINRAAAPNTSVVAFRDPLLYLYTGRHAEGLHASAVENGVSRILNITEFGRRRGHRYILIGPQDPEFDVNPTRAAMIRALDSDGACRRVFSAEGADVYEVTEDPSRSPE